MSIAEPGPTQQPTGGPYPQGAPAPAPQGYYQAAPFQPGPLGTPTKVGKQILLTIVTFGIMGFVWNYRQYCEIKRYSGEGVDGFAAFICCWIGLVNAFYLPSLIEKMYQKEGQPSPVSAMTGLWAFVPFAWYLKVQKSLNEFWVGHGASMPA